MKFTSQIYSKGRAGGGAWVTCQKDIFTWVLWDAPFNGRGSHSRRVKRERGKRGEREEGGLSLHLLCNEEKIDNKTKAHTKNAMSLIH